MSVIKVMKALIDLGIDKFIEVINEIYDNSEILEDLRRAMFIALLNKPGTKVCKSHLLMVMFSQITKY